MHPIERLRFVARATNVPSDLLARETAMALSDFVGDDAGLLIACKRILDRHPTAATLVWLVAHVLSAPEPQRALWDAVEDIERTSPVIAFETHLPADASLAALGIGDHIVELARVRGDLAFVVIDTPDTTDYELDRLRDHGHDVTWADAAALGQALPEASHVCIELDALGPDRAVAQQGAFPLAAVARRLGLPVWGMSSVGVALPARMYDGLISRWTARTPGAPWDRLHEELPADLFDAVVDGGELVAPDEAVRNGRCPMVPELY